LFLRDEKKLSTGSAHTENTVLPTLGHVARKNITSVLNQTAISVEHHRYKPQYPPASDATDRKKTDNPIYDAPSKTPHLAPKPMLYNVWQEQLRLYHPCPGNGQNH